MHPFSNSGGGPSEETPQYKKTKKPYVHTTVQHNNHESRARRIALANSCAEEEAACLTPLSEGFLAISCGARSSSIKNVGPASATPANNFGRKQSKENTTSQDNKNKKFAATRGRINAKREVVRFHGLTTV